MTYCSESRRQRLIDRIAALRVELAALHPRRDFIARRAAQIIRERIANVQKYLRGHSE